MQRRDVRKIFLILFALLPAQYALVGWGGLLDAEPWPAVVLPGFKNVWHAGDSFTIPKATFHVRFDGRESVLLEPARVLAPLPASHHLALMRKQFTPATRSGTTQSERGRLPASRLWLSERVAAFFPGEKPVGADVIWFEMEYRPGSSDSRLIPIDTLYIDFD